MDESNEKKNAQDLTENTEQYTPVNRNTGVIIPVNVEPALPVPVFNKWRELRKFSRKVLNAKKWEQRVKPKVSDKSAEKNVDSDSDDESESDEKEAKETHKIKNKEVVNADKKKSKLDGPHILKIVAASLFFIIALIKLIIGGIYIDKCPVETKIPIWLIVSGTFILLLCILALVDLLFFLFSKAKAKKKSTNLDACIELIFYLLFLFYFAWFICGNSWVFGSKYKVQYVEGQQNYCHEICYIFSFAIIIGMWCIAGIILLFIGFLLIVSCFSK